MPQLPWNFGLLEPGDSDYSSAEAAVLPLPFERTTSYGKGTAHGPAAILRASQAMELWDEELQDEPYRQGIATLPAFLPDAFPMASALAEIEVACAPHMRAGKFLVTLGGEHSLTLAPVRAARHAFGDVGVVQFDAHADLRDEYEGTPYSHASVMRRVVEDGVSTLGVGIRSLSRPEAELVRERDLAVVWGHELAHDQEAAAARFARGLAALPERVYLTFDIDYFDPALVPSTGTPEPGGGLWHSTLALLRQLFRTKQVVAMDLVELAPLGGQPASDFLAAKLVYKCLGYRRAAAARRA
jgi:agmatinase